MLAPQLGLLPQYFHRAGRMAQEAGRGYYVDIYMQLTGEYPAAAVTRPISVCKTGSLICGRFLPVRWSMALLSNCKTRIWWALPRSRCWKSPTRTARRSTWRQQQLVNDSRGHHQLQCRQKCDLQQLRGQGYYVLLSANGSNHVNSVAGSWAGYGYEARQAINGMAAQSAMIISGSYNGGYSSDPWRWWTVCSLPPPTTISRTIMWRPPSPRRLPPLAIPVDAADGTFQVEHTDLSAGQAEPRGLSLSRYYNGTRRCSNRGPGGGLAA